MHWHSGRAYHRSCRKQRCIRWHSGRAYYSSTGGYVCWQKRLHRRVRHRARESRLSPGGCQAKDVLQGVVGSPPSWWR